MSGHRLLDASKKSASGPLDITRGGLEKALRQACHGPKNDLDPAMKNDGGQIPTLKDVT